jgi:hypothetical protein
MRQPQPWFRTSKNAWYVEFDGRQRSLGRHPENALPPKRVRPAGIRRRKFATPTSVCSRTTLPPSQNQRG